MFRPDPATLTPSVSLSLKKRQRLDALLRITNAQQRLGSLVDAARRLPSLADGMRTAQHQVPGCMVRTWFVTEIRDGRCYFHADSDAAMLKALLGLLCEIYSGHAPEEIASDTGELLSDIGVLHQLAENRQRTLRRVSEQLKAFALKHAIAPEEPQAAVELAA